jgi:hypothetical protein
MKMASNLSNSMRFTFPLLLLVTAAFGQAATPQPAPPGPAIPVQQENARKAQALLAQAIQALGGQAYLSIQDVSQQGRTYSFHLGIPNSLGVQFWHFYKYPDKDRTELTKKRDVVYIENGDRGYEVTYKGTRQADPKDLADFLRRRRYALDWVLRHWLHEPGVALFYDGPAVAAEKSTERVTIMNTHDQAVILYLDTDTHLPVKKTFSWRDPTDRQRNVEDEVFDNYRPVQGIMTPFSITRFYNGDMSNQRFLTSVSFNQGLSDSLFQASVPSRPPKK